MPTTCPKCGADDVEKLYVRRGDPRSPSFVDVDPAARHCSSCGAVFGPAVILSHQKFEG